MSTYRSLPGTQTLPVANARPGRDDAGERQRRVADNGRGLWSLPEARWAMSATALFAIGAVLHVAGAPTALVDVVFIGCYGAGGWEPAVAGLRAARGRVLDVDLLMIVGAIGAAAIGQVLDGGLLIVIFATSGATEAYATMRTSDSVRALLTLAPDQASLIEPDGNERRVDAADLVVGDVIVVRPGEIIGADGTVVSGASDVDQASITGEPLPVFRTIGDDVFAGTLNSHGALTVAVSRPAADSVVARIVALVEQASATKARTQLFIENIEQRYSVGVVVTTLAVFAVPLATGSRLAPTLLRAMTYMIVASPCAVVLATMPPLLAAIANAGRHGVLVKSAVVMEQLGLTTVVAFDKTGTLTHGTPQVREVITLSGPDELEALCLAAAAERGSEHPVARAIVAAAHARGLTVPDVTDFSSTLGRGVTASIASRTVHVGSPALLGASPTEAAATGRRAVAELEAIGRTAVVVIADQLPLAVIGLTDRVRDGAALTLDAVRLLTVHEPVLLTGDNVRAARQLADETGIGDVRAALLPHEKVAAVDDLRHSGLHVMVVGDGINDAPALAAAQLGVAMGRSGSDLALSTADAVLVTDDLAALPAMITLSRGARRAVRHNLVLAVVAIAGLISWDLIGNLPLPIGVLGHEGGTVLIGLNGLRMLRSSAWRPAGLGEPDRSSNARTKAPSEKGPHASVSGHP
jgi:heavy metal translocating P-type ATPase